MGQMYVRQESLHRNVEDIYFERVLSSLCPWLLMLAFGKDMEGLQKWGKTGYSKH